MMNKDNEENNTSWIDLNKDKSNKSDDSLQLNREDQKSEQIEKIKKGLEKNLKSDNDICLTTSEKYSNKMSEGIYKYNI